jgi:hypothetical protein
VSETVDIDLVKRNAIAQGIALQQIAILYVGLDETEKNGLKALKLLKTENANTVVATFTTDGDPLFREKITGTYYLAAD